MRDGGHITRKGVAFELTNPHSSEQGLRGFYHPTSIQFARAKRTQCRGQEREAFGFGGRGRSLVWLWKYHHAPVSQFLSCRDSFPRRREIEYNRFFFLFFSRSFHAA